MSIRFHFNLACPKRITLIVILLIFSTNLVSQNTIDELSSAYAKFQVLPKKEKFTKEYAKLLNNFADYYRFRNADSLKFFAFEAQKVSSEINYRDGLITAKIRIGDYYTDIENALKAEEKYLEAEKIINAKDNPELTVKLLRSLSLFYLFNQRLKEGINSSYKAISISRSNSLIETESIIRHNLGLIYWSNKLYEEAEIEYLVADSLSTIINNKISSAKTKSNLGLNAIRLNNLKAAKKYIDESFKVFEEANDLLWLSRNSRVKSEYFIASKNYNEAIQWVKKADSLLNFAYNPRDKLLVLKSYCSIYLKTNQLKKVRAYSNKLLTLAKELDNTEHIQKSFYYLKETEFLNKNFNEMITYNRAFDSLQIIIDKNGKDTNLQFLRAKLEYDKKQLKIQSENTKKLAEQKAVNGIIVFALIISLLTAIVIRQNYIIQKKANENLKDINATKDKIFSIIGHDLKTPLNTLTELLNLLKEKVISPKEMITLTPKIQNNIDHSTFTLNNLLYWAQSQMNAIIANTSEVNIKSIIDDTISIFEIEAEKKNIDITNGISKESNIKFDCEHLRIIFRNLINNAIKFTPQNGQITISSKNSSETIEINFCNTGLGLTKDAISKIINPKEMYSTKGTNNEKGTGLGLSISQELLFLNNSQLKIEPNTPNGSCFTTVIRK